MQNNVENLIERIENQLKQLESYTYDESHVKTLEVEQKKLQKIIEYECVLVRLKQAQYRFSNRTHTSIISLVTALVTSGLLNLIIYIILK